MELSRSARLLLTADSKQKSFDQEVHIIITFLSICYIGKSYSRAVDQNASYDQV